MIPDTIHQKLRFARTRLNNLETLIAANQLTPDPDVRQQIIQEFFFHLVGSIDYLAQLISRNLGLIDENKKHRITPKAVINKLNNSDPIRIILESLWADPNYSIFPTNPYSEEGLIYRLINYRNEVVHRNTNPFHFCSTTDAFFWLDPRDHRQGQSIHPVDVDLSYMFSLVDGKCREVLAILDYK